MKTYIYESKDPKKYAANFFADVFLKETGEKFNPKDYDNLPREQNGKPLPIVLKSGEEFHFSISHSGNFFAMATGNYPLGIDIIAKEKNGRSRKITARSLRKILSPKEPLINNNPLYNFVVKEAYSKQHGEGLGIGFSTLNAGELIKKYHPYFFESPELICYVFYKK